MQATAPGPSGPRETAEGQARPALQSVTIASFEDTRAVSRAADRRRVPQARRALDDGAQAVPAAPKKPRSDCAIPARVAMPETTTSTIVSEVCVWPRAVACRTGTPAAARACA